MAGCRGHAVPGGLTLVERVPQGHKVALVDLAAATGAALQRGHRPRGEGDPARELGARERCEMPAARSLEGLPISTVKRAPLEALEGYTFEGYRNADGSVGTRNILAITQTVQCVSGVVDYAVKRIKDELLPKYPNVDDVIGLAHSLRAAAWRSTRRCQGPDPHAAQHHAQPQLRQRGDGGEPRLREAAARAPAAAGLLPDLRRATSPTWARCRGRLLTPLCLQDDAHVGFMSMIDSIRPRGRGHLERLNARRRETVPGERARVGVQCGGSDAFSGGHRESRRGLLQPICLVRAGCHRSCSRK
jgi:galactarate dehydratase